MHRVTTTSGAVYLIDGKRVRREVGEDSSSLRRDGEWLEMWDADVSIEVGVPMILLLSPLGVGEHGSNDVTQRTTTPVVSIEDVE